ncbi:hypothetical protein GDO78_021052 [Eleutherodactylus coqui]|uniref:Uncharacterized protein n=1 Tax=Eleutherodactylus coqui TaxID=57060 RepID=A0A8J6BBJ4_ELECQ|nr:hypothetical protein GDO78_021052 [Eleutherodactylus coqui]
MPSKRLDHIYFSRSPGTKKCRTRLDASAVPPLGLHWLIYKGLTTFLGLDQQFYTFCATIQSFQKSYIVYITAAYSNIPD